MTKQLLFIDQLQDDTKLHYDFFFRKFFEVFNSTAGYFLYKLDSFLYEFLGIHSI